MKRVALALAVFVSLMLPSTSHAEWWKVGENTSGRAFYIDTKIRQHNGLIYFWELMDYIKPDKHGDLSAKVYSEADCEKFRRRMLQDSYHTEPMGRGSSSAGGPVPDDPWRTPFPRSIAETVLETACKMANR